MALNNFDASVVTRSKGQNVIARAAYNAREALRDERTGESKDYSKKPGLEWNGIFAPKNTPAWLLDRGRLWNEIERCEDRSTRPDQAQLARDFKIALPHELNADQRRQLVTDFARELSRKGMILDVAIHRPDPHSDERNFHVHMLVTMREVTPDGFGNKVRAWNKPQELVKWKERWSQLGARYLERAGFAQEAERFRVGHLTLKEQRKHATRRGDNEWADSLDRNPTTHLGSHAAAMERRGILTESGALNREIKAQNRLVAGLKHELGRIDTLIAQAPSFRLPSGPGKVSLRGITSITDSFSNALESLLSPKLTPQQQREADLEADRREDRDAAAQERLLKETERVRPIDHDRDR